MIQILEYTEGNIIAAKASKKITTTDYYKLLPLFVNRLKQYPNIRLYLDIADLEGIDLHELREEMDFNTGLASVFDKVALLGKKTDEPRIKDLLNYFSSAEVRGFDVPGKDAAIAWLKTDRRKAKDLADPETAQVLDCVLSGA